MKMIQFRWPVRKRKSFVVAILCGQLVWPMVSDSAEMAVIQGILSSKCLHCHGPDENSREADLRLDIHESVVEMATEIGKRILSHDEDIQMPPPDSGKLLTEDEQAMLVEWLDAGAPWKDHWAYENLVRPDIPKIPNDNWSRTPIDKFIRAKNSRMGLDQNPEADPVDLVRRMTYNLTGLPPTPEESHKFKEAWAEDAEKAVNDLADKLLGSPAYGERWGRHWLDVARYADTCGYDKDKLRPNAWPYRDYVIRSFNENKPYKRFVEEQIAGDVIYPGTTDGILGLGFLAAGPWDFIGHVEVPETKLDGQIARNIDRDEMVTAVTNVFASTTAQCARCHDHKFDPINQKHYYGLQAVFAAVDRAERVYEVPQEIRSTRLSLDKKISELEKEISNAREKIEKIGGDELMDAERELESASKNHAQIELPAEYGYHSAIAASPDDEKWIQIEFPEPLFISEIHLRPCYDEFAGIGAGFGFPRKYSVQVNEHNDQGKEIPDVTILTTSELPSQNHPLEVVKIQCHRRISSLRLTARILAERKSDYILALAEMELLGEDGENLADKGIITSRDSIEAPPRWSLKNLTDGKYPKPKDEDAYQKLVKAKEKISSLQARPELQDWINRMSALERKLSLTQDKIGKLPEGKLVYAAATEFRSQGAFKPTGGIPRKIRILRRGDISSPGKEALPMVLPLIQGSPAEIPMTTNKAEGEYRKYLAEWLVREDNPLTWRSIANRIWLWHIGEGLVSTPNDFGKMGQPPSHPQLLDWLATEFRDSGGNFKALHKLIVTSATYRQSSSWNESNADLDYSNRYLWRMNRRRLQAEEIRDSILMVSGALNPRMGGPGFYLFQLEKTDHSPHYEYHKYDPSDINTHRRSVYRFIVRSQPDPFMTTLDCADSNFSTPQRSETQTALQALSLLNNKFNTHMATHFASDLKKSHFTAKEIIDEAFHRVTGRYPREDEARSFVEYMHKHGLSNTCRLMFNLSEFTYIN